VYKLLFAILSILENKKTIDKNQNMEYTISYKKVRHGYARLSQSGKLSITIPYSLKNNESFKNNLIEK